MGTTRSLVRLVLFLFPVTLIAAEPSVCLTPTARGAQMTQGAGSPVPRLEPGSGTSPSGSAPAPAPAGTDTANWPAKPWPQGMVWIPPGQFDMGGIGPEARKDEFPIHRVRVDGFWMDETVVTNAEFRKFVKATDYLTTAEKKPDWNEMKKTLPPGTPKPQESMLVPGSMVFVPTKGPVPLDDPSRWWKWTPGASWKHPFGPGSRLEAKDDGYPVVHVSWEDAVAYCKWAGKHLPTEAEWEYACLGGGPARRFIWGEKPPSNTFHPANLWQGGFPYERKPLDGYLYTAPAKSFEPNGYGLYNMIGNVWEWCSDWYRDDYYATLAQDPKPAVNPRGPEESRDPDNPFTPMKVTRGGSFLCNEGYCSSYRPAARMKSSPDSGLSNVGFRAVMSDADWRKRSAGGK
jgi:formylglycine-generating enzyme